MQISHAQARRYIQLDSDRALSQLDKAVLQSHLAICSECQHYADSIQQMEGLLVPLLHRQWDLSPAPLSIDVIKVGKSKFLSGSDLLTTRTALIGLVCMLLIFSIWQLTVSSAQTPGSFTAAVPPIPTPSRQSTLTSAAQKNCSKQSYVVRENDTLESIASQFASSQQEIMDANPAITATLQPFAMIWIPVCTLTPTGTLNASPTTYTPSTSPTISTPDG
jgi:LysM domain.